MIRVLKILWPALIPLLIYAVWCILRYRKKQRGEEVGPITKPLFLTLISSLAIAMLCFVFFGAQQGANEGRNYVPAHVVDGVVVPGRFE